MRDIEIDRPYLCYPFGVSDLLKQNHGIHSLTQLIEERSRTFHEPVIGMPYKTSDTTWECDMYTYRDLLNGVNALCHYFLENEIILARRKEDGIRSMSVALIAPSNLDMLMVMLAMQRLGLAVLLISPNQTQKVIIHLCQELGVSQTITQLEIPGLSTTPMPPRTVWKEAVHRPGPDFKRFLEPEQEGETYGVIYHSSGTTSGLPKPLPSKHRFLVSFCAHKETSLATLTTTPLNTGGTADVCRSMCADAMLFLFPDSVPLTALNVRQARDACSHALGREIRALSCVPYVAKMLAEQESSMEMLQRLQFLGVGGAPLPKSVGDALVDAGVPLVSRMGSSECNFLMSSYRDYANDKDWDYLRSEPGGHFFRFIPQSDGTDNCELEVSASWPALAVKPNHNGAFRTGDLFQPHPSTPNAWLYLGRSDDTIILQNGKKADPKLLESALRSLTYIKDALVFGVGKNNIGVLVISDLEVDSETGKLRQKIWQDVVQDINKISPPHAELYIEMIQILPAAATFEKTAKGSIIRNNTYAKYAKEIDASYMQSSAKRNVHDADLHKYISEVTRQVTTQDLGLDEDLFTAGVNSLQSVRIRNIMSGELDVELPSNIVFEEPTIRKLADHIKNFRSGKARTTRDSKTEMLELVSEYSYKGTERTPKNSNGTASRISETQQGDVVLLTGSTGGLGSHLLRELLSTTLRKINKVLCLMRSHTSESPQRRMQNTLAYRKITLPESVVSVEYINADLAMPQLGLSDEAYKLLQNSVTICIHAAWPVNFNASLSSFKASILSTANLLEFCRSSSHPSKFYFCSSTAATINSKVRALPEKGSHEPGDASPVGYSQSKWVTESIISSYKSAFPTPSHLGIFRIGQLCGDTKTGVWSESEAWSLMFASINVISAMPRNVGEEQVIWLPVDIAARAILEVSLCEHSSEQSHFVEDVPVWNIVNPKNETKWGDILSFFKDSGFEFKVVDAKDWVQSLAASTESDNPSRKLLHLWQSSFESGFSKPDPVFDTTKAVQFSQSLRNAQPISMDLMRRTFMTWQERGFLR